uniref:Uncharacterized protein n=1 Tax=Rhizoctonia cerealis phyllomonavirus TaxID=3068671 RepID=A0AA51BT65_9MONO|nr:MAG: hypothetical protein [Rhizoctonia cerealis phyllomonavirus]
MSNYNYNSPPWYFSLVNPSSVDPLDRDAGSDFGTLVATPQPSGAPSPFTGVEGLAGPEDEDAGPTTSPPDFIDSSPSTPPHELPSRPVSPSGMPTSLGIPIARSPALSDRSLALDDVVRVRSPQRVRLGALSPEGGPMTQLHHREPGIHAQVPGPNANPGRPELVADLDASLPEDPTPAEYRGRITTLEREVAALRELVARRDARDREIARDFQRFVMAQIDLSTRATHDMIRSGFAALAGSNAPAASQPQQAPAAQSNQTVWTPVTRSTAPDPNLDEGC